MPAEKDPFEIARRLDQFGAGKRPPRPEVASAPVIPPPAKKRKARSVTKTIALILILALSGWFVFKSVNRPSLRPASHSRQAAVMPVASPPKTIPALDGKGEVPAFTVQVPGRAAASASPKSEARAGE